MCLSLSPQWLNDRARYRVGLLALCLLALALRLYLLEDLFLHDDEAVSRELYVRQPIMATLTHYSPNNHWLISLLGHLLGRLGEPYFLLRWPSVWFGTLAVPLIGTAGYRLFRGRGVGLAAAWLLCISAFHIEWSQQFRGYSALLFFALLAFLFLDRALQSGRRLHWAGFGVAIALSIASHLYGILMLLASVTLLLAWSWRKRPQGHSLDRRRTAAILLTSLVLTGCAVWFAKINVVDHYHASPPANVVQYLQYQWLAFRPTLPAVDDFLKETASAFTAHSDDNRALVLFWGLSLSGGALAWARFRRAALGLLVWLLLPMGLIIAAEFAWPGFFVFDRYLIFTLPAWILLSSVGLLAGGSRLAARLTSNPSYRAALLLAVLTIGLGYLVWLDFNAARSYLAGRAGHDWRGVAATLADQVAPDDLIMCVQLPHRWPPRRLDLGDQCTKAVQQRLAALDVTPRFPIRQLEVVAALGTGLRFKEQADRPGAVWVVLWGPTGLPGSATVRAVGPDRSPGSDMLVVNKPLLKIPEPVTFNRLGPTALLKVDSEPSLVANLGQALHHLARLDTVSADRYDYDLRRAQVLAYQGRTAAAQHLFELTRASPGVQPEALAETAHALQLVDELNRSPGIPTHPLNEDFGVPAQLRLLAVGLPDSVAAGDVVPLTLAWQALDQIGHDYTAFVHLHDPSGRTVAQLDFQPFDGAYPTSHWSPGQTIEETRLWTLPAELPAGPYTLVTGLYQVDSLTRLPIPGRGENNDTVLLGQVWVR